MKEILMSIRPQHLVNILNGKKTIELRKKFPSDYRGWVYCYCTLGKPYLYECALYSLAKEGECAFVHNDKDETALNFLSGKVVCRFWVDNVEELTARKICGEWEAYGTEHDFIELSKQSCLSQKELVHYLCKGGKCKGFAIHISKLEIFDKPKELNEFYYYKKRLIDCGMDCPPYFDEVKTQVRKAPQSWQYIYIEEDK